MMNMKIKIVVTSGKWGMETVHEGYAGELYFICILFLFKKSWQNVCNAFLVFVILHPILFCALKTDHNKISLKL